MAAKQDSSAATTTRKPRAIATKKMSLYQQQYHKAIAMPDAELGAAIKAPTERIALHVGNAVAHDAEAKKERREAQQEFQRNIGFYCEVKYRLLNPGYRTDLGGGKERTPDENERNFGAPDWAAFVGKSVAYSLQHADRMLKTFEKANGLLTDDGENIDDPEPEENGGAGQPQPRRTEDPTAQRYEFIATKAMEIASRNPEGEVERQILAAAEHAPAPLMPVPPDVYTEVLEFLARISSMAADGNIRAEAKQPASKMRLHQPAPETTVVPPAVAKEEKRKRDKRLGKKNGEPLGSAACAPATAATSEHVQRSVAEASGGTVPQEGTETYKERKARQQREYYWRTKDRERAAALAAQEEAGSMSVASEGAPQPAATPTARHGGGEKAQKHTASPEVTVCPPAQSREEEERKHGALDAASGRPGSRQGNFVLNENGKYEYEPELGIREAEDGGYRSAAQTGGVTPTPVGPAAAVRP